METTNIIKKVITKKKFCFSIFTIVTLALSSCSSNFDIISNIKNEPVININSGNNKGASIPFKISLNNFSLKLNENGVPTSFEAVDHYLVYLIKNSNTSSYPLNGDPIGSDRVSGPFLLNAKGSNSRNFILNNVLPLTSGAYYIAIRIQDNNNQDLIKNNNGSLTAWTGSTSSIPGVAVSSGSGISVDSELVVSSTTPLSLTANLKDGQGAKIETNINPAHGNLNSASVSGNSVITTFAGNGTIGDSGENGIATNAEVNFLGSGTGITTDSKGNVYFSTDGKIKRVSPNGIISTFAGGGSDLSDGINAKLAEIDPAGLVFDSKGNLYISDFTSIGIRKISTDGIISSLSTVLSEPQGLAISGNYLYVADKFDQIVYKVNLTTEVTDIFAGGGVSTSEGIPATNAQLGEPKAIVADSLGNIYFTDSSNNKIRKVDTSGNISTVAGGGASTAENVPATTASLNSPEGITIDSSGNLYFSDSGNKKIRKINTSGNISTVAGSGATTTFVEENFALDEALGIPSSIAMDKTGNLYFQENDTTNNKNRVRKVIF